jgi:hypothetical protein
MTKKPAGKIVETRSDWAKDLTASDSALILMALISLSSFVLL